MELWAMEGLHISFPSNQTQPDVVEPEHLESFKNKLITAIFYLGVVGCEVHINKSLSRKYIGTSCYVWGPKVVGVLIQTNKPL